jgi:hypothetical protein
MRGTDLVLIILTFLTGIFCGVYMYITVFAPAYRVEESPLSVKDTSFAVMGQQYGACDETLAVCDSFTVLEDRSYTFAAGYVPSEPAPKDVTGKLSRDTYDTLLTEVAAADLARLETEQGACATKEAGEAYRYRVIYEGEEYFFDTCDVRFSVSVLGLALEAVWGDVAVSRTILDDAGDVKLGETVESFIDDTFQYDDQ